MRLRKADMSADVSKIVALCKLSLSPSMVWCDEKRFLDHINSPLFRHEYCFLAEARSDIIGYIEGNRVDALGLGVIQIVVVHPECLGKGVGTRLVRTLEDEFRKYGLVEISAGIDISTHVRPFYTKQGYTEFCTITGFQKDLQKIQIREMVSEDLGNIVNLRDYVFGTELAHNYLEVQLSNPSLNLRYTATLDDTIVGLVIGSFHDGIGEINRIFFREGYGFVVYDLILTLSNLLKERNAKTLFLYASKHDEEIFNRFGFEKSVTTEVLRKRLK